MSNTEKIEAGLDALIAAAQNMVDATKALKEIMSAEAAPKASKKTASKQLFEPTPSKKEETEAEPEVKTYTFQEVRGIMANLSGSGKKAEAKALLTKFGASRLSEVKEEDFPALVAEAEAILNG